MSRNPEHKPKPQPQHKKNKKNGNKKGPKPHQKGPNPTTATQQRQKRPPPPNQESHTNEPSDNQGLLQIVPTNSELTSSFFAKRIQQSNEQITLLSNEKDSLRAQLDQAYIEFEERCMKLEEEKINIQRDFESRFRELQNADQQRSSIKDTLESFQNLFAKLTAEKEKLEAENQKQKQAIQTLQKEREFFNSNGTTVRLRFDLLRERLLLLKKLGRMECSLWESSQPRIIQTAASILPPIQSILMYRTSLQL